MRAKARSFISVVSILCLFGNFSFSPIVFGTVEGGATGGGNNDGASNGITGIVPEKPVEASVPATPTPEPTPTPSPEPEVLTSPQPPTIVLAQATPPPSPRSPPPPVPEPTRREDLLREISELARKLEHDLAARPVNRASVLRSFGEFHANLITFDQNHLSQATVADNRSLWAAIDQVNRLIRDNVTARSIVNERVSPNRNVWSIVNLGRQEDDTPAFFSRTPRPNGPQVAQNPAGLQPPLPARPAALPPPRAAQDPGRQTRQSLSDAVNRAFRVFEGALARPNLTMATLNHTYDQLVRAQNIFVNTFGDLTDREIEVLLTQFNRQAQLLAEKIPAEREMRMIMRQGNNDPNLAGLAWEARLRTLRLLQAFSHRFPGRIPEELQTAILTPTRQQEVINGKITQSALDAFELYRSQFEDFRQIQFPSVRDPLVRAALNEIHAAYTDFRNHHALQATLEQYQQFRTRVQNLNGTLRQLGIPQLAVPDANARPHLPAATPIRNPHQLLDTMISRMRAYLGHFPAARLQLNIPIANQIIRLQQQAQQIRASIIIQLRNYAQTLNQNRQLTPPQRQQLIERRQQELELQLLQPTLQSLQASQAEQAQITNQLQTLFDNATRMRERATRLLTQLQNRLLLTAPPAR